MNHLQDTAYQTTDGKIVSFTQDTSPESPREWDNLGQLMIKGGRNHISCDEHEDYNTGLLVAYHDEMTAEEAQSFLSYNGTYMELSEIRSAFAEFKREIAVILPVYRYEHGGVAYNTTGFSCSWDSGKIGVIFATKKQIELSFKRISVR